MTAWQGMGRSIISVGLLLRSWRTHPAIFAHLHELVAWHHSATAKLRMRVLHVACSLCVLNMHVCVRVCCVLSHGVT